MFAAGLPERATWIPWRLWARGPLFPPERGKVWREPVPPGAALRFLFPGPVRAVHPYPWPPFPSRERPVPRRRAGRERTAVPRRRSARLSERGICAHICSFDRISKQLSGETVSENRSGVSKRIPRERRDASRAELRHPPPRFAVVFAERLFHRGGVTGLHGFENIPMPIHEFLRSEPRRSNGYRTEIWRCSYRRNGPSPRAAGSRNGRAGRCGRRRRLR